MNWPPFPASESSLGFKVPPSYRTTSLPEVRPLGRALFVNSLGRTGCPLPTTRSFILAAIEFPKLWLRKTFVARLRSETRAKTKPNMKATTVQLPVRLTKPILLPGSGPPQPARYPRPLIENRSHRYWYAFFRSLRAVLSRVLDRSAYDQISLGREVFVAFTAQGPVVYRYGWNSAVDVSATGEANGKARSTKQS